MYQNLRETGHERQLQHGVSLYLPSHHTELRQADLETVRGLAGGKFFTLTRYVFSSLHNFCNCMITQYFICQSTELFGH
jgi:hypothetical protein